jgi:hypothetical protein
VMSCTTVPPSIRRRVPGCCTSKIFTPSMAFAPVVRARLPLFPLASRGRLTTLQGSLDAADRLLARPQRDFVVTLRRSGLPSRRPPATALLGHYAGRTLTGKFITAFRTHTTATSDAHPAGFHFPAPHRL